MSGGKLYAALQAKPQGASLPSWIAVAWSPDGSMVGSDAVIGLQGSGSKPGSVGAYRLASYSGATATSAFAVTGNPSVVKSSAGLLMT